MNRKHMLSVITLLILLVPACLAPAAALPTASAPVPATATAAIGSAPTSTQTPAPTDTIPAPTSTQPPTATPTSTDTPGPTNTPTEQPPLAAVADICKLLDANAIGVAIKDKIVTAKKTSTLTGGPACEWSNQQHNTHLTLVVAQDEVAVKFDVNFYAAYEAAKNCAIPAVSNAAVEAKAQAEFDKLGLTGNARVRESLARLATLIQQQGCADKYKYLPVPGLGDAAFFESAPGIAILHAVDRNTVVTIDAYRGGMADADRVTMETSFMATVLKELEAR